MGRRGRNAPVTGAVRSWFLAKESNLSASIFLPERVSGSWCFVLGLFLFARNLFAGLDRRGTGRRGRRGRRGLASGGSCLGFFLWFFAGE